MSNQIKLSLTEKAILIKALEFNLEKRETNFKSLYKKVLNKITVCDCVTLNFNSNESARR